MRVLVAGASGALGEPTVRLLVDRGHEVFGLTRSEAKAKGIEALGARPVFGDVLAATDVNRVVDEVRPEGVAQLLNAIPKRGPIRPKELDATNVLREVGTRNLLAAVKQHGKPRYVVESMIFGYGYGDRGGPPLTEEAPYGRTVAAEQMNPALNALADMEQQVLQATERGEAEGVVLRLGLFYGPGVGSTEFMISMLKKKMMFLPGGGKGQLSWIHVEDGAAAVVDSLEKAPPGSVYNVVDDEPASMWDMCAEMGRTLDISGPKSIPVGVAKIVSSYAAMMASTNLRVSNAKIKKELGWVPRFPTHREGAKDLLVAASR